MLSKEQLEKIANPGPSDIGGAQSPIVTEMATELLSLREQLAEKEERLCRLRTSLEIEMKGHEAAERQLAELKALPPFAYATHRNTGVMWFVKDKPMCSEFVGIPLFTAAKPS
ncbi:hypothetical protein ACU01S_002519 [Yersinia enterocolitica]